MVTKCVPKAISLERECKHPMRKATPDIRETILQYGMMKNQI